MRVLAYPSAMWGSREETAKNQPSLDTESAAALAEKWNPVVLRLSSLKYFVIVTIDGYRQSSLPLLWCCLGKNQAVIVCHGLPWL